MRILVANYDTEWGIHGVDTTIEKPPTCDRKSRVRVSACHWSTTYSKQTYFSGKIRWDIRVGKTVAASSAYTVFGMDTAQLSGESEVDVAAMENLIIGVAWQYGNHHAPLVLNGAGVGYNQVRSPLQRPRRISKVPCSPCEFVSPEILTSGFAWVTSCSLLALKRAFAPNVAETFFVPERYGCGAAKNVILYVRAVEYYNVNARLIRKLTM